MNKKKWIGVWWLYSEENSDCHRVPGTLSFTEDGHLELWLSPLPNENSLNCIFRKHYTIWGIDENDVPITLFNAIGHEFYLDMVKSVRAAIALIGLHVKSLDTPCVTTAGVHFPYLNNLYFKNFIDIRNAKGNSFTLIKEEGESIHPIKIDRYTNWELRSTCSLRLVSRYIETRISQDTYFYINSKREFSLKNLDKQIREFSDFLSFALLKEQNPDEIVLFNKEYPHEKFYLYYKFRPSTNPYDSILTRGLPLEQLDALIVNWHKSYSTLRQVYISFERAGNRRDGIGGVPEFLHAEIALEGYYKRFHQNILDEVPVDAIVYCENILKELLRYYAPIDIVKKLNLNVKRIKNTRNAYVHLFNNTKQIYSEPYDLWVITEKLRVLTICCLLHHLGFSFEEINTRIKSANIFLPESYVQDSWF